MNNKRYKQFLRLLEVSQAMINRTLNKYVQQGADPEIARSYLERYNKLNMANRLSVDLQVVPFERLKQLVDNTEAVKSKTQEKKDVVMKGSELVYQNDDWKVYRIDTVEASCKLGSMSKWCISREGNSYFDEYNKKYTIYFVLNQKGLDNKYAVLVDRNGNLNVWDKDDENINESVMFDDLGKQFETDKDTIFVFKPKVINVYDCIQGEYTIKPDGTVDVKGSVDFEDIGMDYITVIPLKFGIVTGNFSCSNCALLTSLQGAPKRVGGDFSCASCKSLTSLQGAPEFVGGDFDCSLCISLTSLRGAPKNVNGSFFCAYCDLIESLQGAPQKVGLNFYCNYCKSLTSLQGAPKNINGNFWCSGCGLLTSLQGSPDHVGGTFFCTDCKSLTTLQGAPESVESVFNCSNCDSLTSLQGAPRYIRGDFYCHGCKKKFTEEEVKAVSKVSGKIYN